MPKKVWELITTTIRLGEPKPLANYLWCGHTVEDMDRSRCLERVGWLNGVTRCLSGAAMLADAAGVGAGPNGGVGRPAVALSMTVRRRGVDFDMTGFIRQCVDRSCEFAVIKD